MWLNTKLATAVADTLLNDGDKVTFNFTATDETAFGSYAVNDTVNFEINSTGWLKDNILFSENIYYAMLIR